MSNIDRLQQVTSLLSSQAKRQEQINNQSRQSAAQKTAESQKNVPPSDQIGLRGVRQTQAAQEASQRLSERTTQLTETFVPDSQSYGKNQQLILRQAVQQAQQAKERLQAATGPVSIYDL